MKWKFSLADGWQKLHKKGTVIVSFIFAIITAVGPSLIDGWNYMPSDLKDALPHGTARIVSVVAFVCVILVRYTSLRRIPKQEDEHANV